MAEKEFPLKKTPPTPFNLKDYLFGHTDRYARIRASIEFILLLALGILAYVNRAALAQSAGTKHTFTTFRSVFILALFLGLVLIFLHPNFSQTASRILNALYLIAVPVYVYLTMEMTTTITVKGVSRMVRFFGYSVSHHTYRLLNLLIICLVLAFFVLLTNSVRVGTEIAAGLLVVFAIVNLYVVDFRGAAITAADLAVVGTALDVAGGYTPKMYIRVFQAIVNLLLLLIVAGRLRYTRISKSLKTYLINLLGVAAVSAAIFYVIFSGFLAGYVKRISYFNTMKYGYRHYGTALTFSRSIADAFPSKPENYSQASVQAIAGRYDSEAPTPAEGVSTENPNILVIVNEAFSDLHELGDFETTENEMAFFDSLTENCISGVSYASVLGGRTANTEFEILTGHSMANLPFGTVPFQIYIKDDMPSLATLLTQQDYAGRFAFHPCPKKNYNRIHAYPFLGFETFYDNKDVPLKRTNVRTFYSDEACYNNLEAICEEIRAATDQPIFAYNMTMQNHSPYNEEYDNFTSDVHAVGLSQTYDDVDQYLSLIKISDEALKDLIGRLEALEEPTVILFVGDHQPSLSTAFYDEVIDAESSDPARDMIQYRVPFKIWANFDIEEQTGIVTSMNYLQLYLLDACKAPRTGYQQFLADLREKVPVITGNGYIGADGGFYQADDTESPYYDLIQDYNLLQYNAMFDKGNRLENFFSYAEE